MNESNSATTALTQMGLFENGHICKLKNSLL